MTDPAIILADPKKYFNAQRAEGRQMTSIAYDFMNCGMSCEEAADLVWRIHTGKPMPVMCHADGSPTFVAIDLCNGADAQYED